MFEGLVSYSSINFFLVFLEGILSFLSPCVLPLIPLYIGYLAGNGKIVESDGSIKYVRKKVLINTIFFVVGISTAFFILGISFTGLGSFLKSNSLIFSKIAGIVIIILGLFQIGLFNFQFMQREHRFNMNIKNRNMNPLSAYGMGFLFSFAWTPCVGPALSSVLILASSAKNALTGNILVLLYTVGFCIPFLIIGLFTTQALNFIKKNRNVMKYTIKAGGIIMVIMGIMTFTGVVNDISGYLNNISDTESSDDKRNDDSTYEDSDYNNQNSSGNSSTENSYKDESKEKEYSDAIDFELTDQYGNVHKLSDYKGKTVFMNFWATWCPPCRNEMPHIEELYNELGKNNDDVVFLGIAQPGGNEKDIDGIKDFLNSQGYTFPVLFDKTGEVFQSYYISSLPTTFMINSQGKIYGYISGGLSKDQMKSIIKQTQEGSNQ